MQDLPHALSPMLELIGPEDAGFDLQRKTFDAIVDARPAAIARCASREDVIAALAFAAERGLPVAVRGGGTSERPRSTAAS